MIEKKILGVFLKIEPLLLDTDIIVITQRGHRRLQNMVMLLLIAIVLNKD